VTNDACSATSGKWVSPFDGATWTAASDVDIDHMVPLKNAWIVIHTAFLDIHRNDGDANILTVGRKHVDFVQADSVCERHQPPPAVGRHRQRQPSQE
jgi:hypothetical protein